jgi:crossover junction endodeoxyribonuclease RuvC
VILGLDPGLRITGFGLVDQLGTQLRYVASGCIKTKDGDCASRRLEKTLLDGVREVIATYQPDVVAAEKVFVNVNPQSTLLLGQARGAVICGAVHASCRWPNTPRCRSSSRWSATARRTRSRCSTWCVKLLSTCRRAGADAADALACAIATPTAGRAWGCWRRPGIAFAAAA